MAAFVWHTHNFLPAQNSELLGSLPQTQASMTNGDWTELPLRLWHVWVGMEELKKKKKKCNNNNNTNEE